MKVSNKKKRNEAFALITVRKSVLYVYVVVQKYRIISMSDATYKSLHIIITRRLFSKKIIGNLMLLLLT